MKLTVKKAFKWAHRHVDVKEYAEGDEIVTDDADLIDVSTREGWAEQAKEEAPAGEADKPAEAAAHGGAAESKAE